MIKHSELLTFSLVYDRYGEVAPYFQAHASLADDNVKIYPESMTMGWVNLKPVPMSDEWLAMLGFIVDNGVWWIDDDKYAFWDNDFVEKDKDSRYSSKAECVLHVHELQLAYFKATGKELTINETA